MLVECTFYHDVNLHSPASIAVMGNFMNIDAVLAGLRLADLSELELLQLFQMNITVPAFVSLPNELQVKKKERSGAGPFSIATALHVATR